MVRRDEAVRVIMRTATRCIHPAGASPVPVSARAPGSRLLVRGETLDAKAERRKPDPLECGGKQAHGPQHEVKPAASTHLQSWSRAAHVTAKATSDAIVLECVFDLGGVWGAARVHGWMRNTRGPSALPQLRQGGSYKPKAKSSAAQRESEGSVVPTIVATKNAMDGKGPCFGHARREGKREGMAAKSGPNDPGACMCNVQVRQLQRELRMRAKRDGTVSCTPHQEDHRQAVCGKSASTV
jgi:hypothetical protein